MLVRSLLFAALVLSAGAPALAQPFAHDDFSSLRFYVAPGPGNFAMVEGTATAPDLTPSAGATLDYAHRPFVADDLDCLTGDPNAPGCETPMNQESALLGPLLTLQLYGAITVLERVQIGLNLPVLLFFEGERYQYVDRSTPSPTPRTAAPGGSGAGLGDPRLSAKVRLLDPDARGDGLSLAASLWLTAPLGHAIWPGHFVGDRYPSLGAQVIAMVRFDALRIAINLGGQVRDEAVNIRSSVGPELTWGAAVAYRFHPLVEALIEASGATSFGLRFDSEAPTEIRAAGLLHFGELSFQLGVGAGAVYGVGVPVARVFAGASYMPAPDRDTDGDGLVDSLDACPADAEDEDGFADEDGCPDDDNDEDTIADASDACPGDAEDLDEHEDEDGCPDEDNDGDGIRDGYDSCPNDAEDMDGDRDGDGCPDTDTDQDGIADAADQCASEAEDFDGLADEDGCPETDADGDGVDDERDECPDVAGERRRGGCPRAAEP